MTDQQGRESARRLIQQRKLLAEFGIYALGTDDLDAVLQRACELVAQGLGAEFAKIVEYLPDEKRLIVRAGVGWRPGVVRRAKMPTDLKSAPGFALQTQKPVITNDTEAEDRFDIPQVLHEHGVRSLVNTLIPVLGEEPFGVLEVDSREAREFTPDDVDFLETYANLLGAIIGHHRQRPLAQEAHRRRVLMKELQHRIVNSLTTIASLISIQRSRASHAETSEALQTLGRRLETLRLLYGRLHASGRPDRIELRAYLGELSASLLDFHGEKAEHVKLTTDLTRMTVTTDAAIPLGMIVNEFITNSLKYAFDGRPGVITLELARAEGQRARLVLRDDGPGVPGQGQAAGGGTGMELIGMLAEQIGATAAWSTSGGVALSLTFATGSDT